MSSADRSASPPSPVLRLVDGAVGWFAAVAAVDLGLFAALADAPDGLDISSLAARCNAPAERVETLCQALEVSGLVRFEGGRCALSSAAAAQLVPGRSAYLGELLKLSPGRVDNWPSLAQVVRGAEPPHPVDDEDATFHAPLARATFGLQLAVASALVAALDLRDRPGMQVADLGAGGGAWSVALLEALPGVTATLVDSAPLLDVALDHALRHEVADRCRFVVSDPGALARDTAPAELGTGADVVVLAHVLRLVEPKQAGALVALAARSLRPGGVVVIADYLLDGDRTSDRASVMGVVTLANTSRGGLVRREQLTAWCAGAGLDAPEDLRLSPVFAVLAARPTA